MTNYIHTFSCRQRCHILVQTTKVVIRIFDWHFFLSYYTCKGYDMNVYSIGFNFEYIYGDCLANVSIELCSFRVKPVSGPSVLSPRLFTET